MAHNDICIDGKEFTQTSWRCYQSIYIIAMIIKGEKRWKERKCIGEIFKKFSFEK